MSLPSLVDCELTENELQCLAQGRCSVNTHGMNKIISMEWGDGEVSTDAAVLSVGG